MFYKKIFNYAVLLVLLLFIKNSYSFERKYLYEIAKETLILHENYELNSEKLEKNFNLIEEIVKLQLSIGYENVDLDLYLFLKGIVKDDIYSLQSLLVDIESQNLSLDLTNLINSSIAKKMSFALKENRISNKTKIKIKLNKNIKSCQFYLNGKVLKNINHFFSPSGIPIYIAIYCEKNFEVQRIIPDAAQSLYTVNFNNLKNKNIVPSSLPNPYPSTYTKNLKSNLQDNKLNEMDAYEIDFSSGYLYNYNKKIHNYYTYNSVLSINNYLLLLGYSKVQVNTKNITILSNNNVFDYFVFEPNNLFKVAFGLKENLLDNENMFQLYVNFLIISHYLFDAGFNYQSAMYGVQSGLSVSYELIENWKIGLNTSLGYNWGILGSPFVEHSLSVSYNFY